MIIDNKINRYSNNGLDIVTVWDFLHLYSGKDSGELGKLDVVTGYFTIATLSKLYEELPEQTRFRIVSSEMVGEEKKKVHIVNLLNDEMDINCIGDLDKHARQAIAFLERDTVEMRAELPDFCHAKAYIFQNNKPSHSNFYVTGSSNMTPSGLGLKPVPNVELNIAENCNSSNADYAALRMWYDDIWSKARTTLPEDSDDPRSKKIPVKEFFIRKIKEYFREYSPEEIYYKILFELFNTELNLDGGIEHTRDMSLLQTSVIWKTLFNYQQQGVISLIKMLRKYNGAILADAVGLGKTFSALAVMKYFQIQNYTTVLLCPKKLAHNWKQYRVGGNSRFDKDELRYEVRFHTDLQNDRLQSAYEDYKLDYLQKCKKVLVVIDESHNLRNEKSGRYVELLEKLIKNQEGQDKRDVKVLMLSATPINTGLNDVKGQFKLIARGKDDAFNTPDFDVESLLNTFKDAQNKYSRWTSDPDRTIGGFISQLPQRFFNLTDKLIVARTRKLIENTLGENLGFPRKEHPVNVYQGVDHFGEFASAEDIYSAFEQLNLTAYQPSIYLHESRREGHKEASEKWDDDINREKFLVKMMCILFMKRLESSWYSLQSTVNKVLAVHEDTLNKVTQYIEKDIDDIIRTGEEVDEDEDDVMVSRRQIKVSDIKNLKGFERGLKYDCTRLRRISDGLKDFELKYQQQLEHDLKLDKLVELLQQKQQTENKKVVIFTAYSDTAKFIFNELKKRGFSRMASVSGQDILTTGNHSVKNFTTILQSFAPYSKLYKELDWSALYERHLSRALYYNDEQERWTVSYEQWMQLVQTDEPEVARVISDGIDKLIATDCLSEGQNLQDADMQINYDIHWNPVRLIQRFGRIDRIGSPNKSISCVNFWPAKSFEEYLQLETRIQNRMLMMNLVGSETQELNDKYIKMVEDNPLQDKNADRLLEELQNNSISDIEVPQTLSLKDFSFESFRQDLTDYYAKQQDFYRRMPNGVYSGFKNQLPEFAHIPESLVALVGYPKKPEGKMEHTYTELYLVLQPVDSIPQWCEVNKADVLHFLQQNKTANRYVPNWITDNDIERVTRLSVALKEWMRAKAPQQVISIVNDVMGGKSLNQFFSTKKSSLVEDKFQIQNFDLIVWEYISAT